MAKNKKIYDKFDGPLVRVVIFAEAASINTKVDCIYPESFAIGMLTTGANEVSSVLDEMDINLEKCLTVLKKELGKKKANNEKEGLPDFQNLKISKQVIEVCKLSDKIRAEVFEGDDIGVQDVFVSLLRISQSVRLIFEKSGLTEIGYIEHFKRGKEMATTGSGRERKSCPSRKLKALDSFCINVTQLAIDNKLDPIIAREAEIEKMITILCRRGKNNPILLGAPGVGKTAIIEGLAQRIVSGTVPTSLKGNKLYSLSLSGLVAGTKYRGDFEDRIQSLVQEVQKMPNCILFIDEIHTLVGAGSAAGGALDASNILKPFLARGDLRCIGATTLDDFKQHFQKDGALTRRFQQILVEEPSKEQMYQILNGIKHKYEEYHSCTISDNAIDAIIRLTDRYQPDKNFPDKAIDTMDTACAKYVSWHISNSQTSSTNIVNKNIVITSDNIAHVVSEQCEMPIEVILWDDNERLKKIGETLSSRVIGQQNAIDVVCRVLKNAYSGIRDPSRPIGSFVFGGQSGTGKTYMAKELAMAVFGKDTSFIRLDMTEFSEKHSVSKLIGSPPGFVGFREADIFIDKIKRKPYCIVLLDELEKAHPHVVKLFMQVMSDGIMTDATGNKADFKNVIFIMTGNFGVNSKKKSELGFGAQTSVSAVKEAQSNIIRYCRERYGAEFVNRVDEFVVFSPLNDSALKTIVKIKLEEVCERLVDRKCTLRFSDSVADLLIVKSKQSHGGNATVLDRLIAREI